MVIKDVKFLLHRKFTLYSDNFTHESQLRNEQTSERKILLQDFDQNVKTSTD